MAAKVRKFNTIVSRRELWTIDELVNARVYLDLSFQSIDRWDEKHQTDYASSIIQNKTTSNILIVDVEACFQNSTKKSDKNYFKAILDMGFKYISVDGNNRKVTANNILNDLVAFHYGIYDGHFIDVDNCYWSTLEDGLKDELLNKKAFRMEILEMATRDDLRDLFLSINDNVEHNPAEKRNAEGSDLANIIREETLRHLGTRDKEDSSKILEYNGTLAKIYEVKDLKRRFGDKWIAEALLFSASKGTQFDLMAPALLKHYRWDDEGPFSDSWKPGLVKVNITLNLIKKYQEKKIKNFHSSYTNLHLLIEWMCNNDFVIKEGKTFYEWWLKTEYDRRMDEEAYEVAKGTYQTYKGCAKQLSKNYVKIRQQTQINDFIKDAATELKGVVVSTDPQRLFSPDQRVELREAQGGKCPETGKTIPITEVMDASKWVADHIIRHTDEGETKLVNGRLVEKKWHDKHSGDQLRKGLDKAA